MGDQLAMSRLTVIDAKMIARAEAEAPDPLTFAIWAAQLGYVQKWRSTLATDGTPAVEMEWRFTIRHPLQGAPPEIVEMLDLADYMDAYFPGELIYDVDTRLKDAAGVYGNWSPATRWYK